MFIGTWPDKKSSLIDGIRKILIKENIKGEKPLTRAQRTYEWRKFSGKLTKEELALEQTNRRSNKPKNDKQNTENR